MRAFDGRPSCECGCGALRGYCFSPAILPIPASVYVTETVAPLGPQTRAFMEQARSLEMPRPTVARLLADVAAGIRMLNTRDGMRLSEDLIQERTNNIVAGLLGNYIITGTGE